MFNRKSKQRPSVNVAQERFDTIIGTKTDVTGDLHVSESIRIDGRLMGNVRAQLTSEVTVVVGAQGTVIGNVVSHRVVVAGRVQGSIEAKEEVELHSGAVIEGDLSCASVSIAHGAQVMGRILAAQDRATAPNDVETVTPVIANKKKVELVA